MLRSFVRLIGGDPNRRDIQEYSQLVAQINALEAEYHGLSDEALRAKTAEFRARLAEGESLEDLLAESFAAVREASQRTLGLRHYDVQLIGGMVLHEGRVAEMRTGEGKTLVATLPLYLNALEGRGATLVTVNDYLARRDARWMGPIYTLLGMTVGVLQEAARTDNARKAFVYDAERSSPQEDVHQLRLVDRREAYAADITYGTNHEFGFDYLRDNLALRREERVQRVRNFAIVDEVDNILIDEARTPLIISGPAAEDAQEYLRMSQVVRQLRPDDYEIDERDRTVTLTEVGEQHAEQVLGLPLRDPDRPEDVTPEQAVELKGRLLAFRAYFIDKALPNVSKPVSGRLGDITRPLLQIARIVNPQVEETLIKLINELNQQRMLEKSETIEAMIIKVICSLENEVVAGKLGIGDITAKYNLGKSEK